jgi:hypothetical protein
MMLKPIKFDAHINDRGVVEPTGPRAVRVVARLQALAGRQALVTIEPERARRSTAQNSRYWVRIVPFAQEVLSVTRDLPLSKDQAHYVLKSAFIGTLETPLGPVPKRSRDLSTAEFAAYCDRIEGHFASLGQFVPQDWRG